MHDVGVIGGGVIGLFTAAAALSRGLDVVCLEAAGEPLGEQSRGEGRIFRVAHERPELCELALRAAERWAECERSAGTRLVDRCGLAVLGEEAESRHAAMREAGAECVLADFGQLGERLPQVRSNGVPVLWDPGGASIRTGALGRWLRGLLGDRLRTGAPVAEATRRGSGWALRTPAGWVTARRVVVCAGADAPAVGAMLGVDVPGWLGVRRTLRLTFARPRMRPAPCVIDKTGEVGRYFLPTVDGDSAGILGSATEPQDDEIGAERFRARSDEACRRYAREGLVGVGPEVVAEVSCGTPISPLLPDGEGWRIIGDGGARVFVGANAYKFAPLIGEELAAPPAV